MKIGIELRHIVEGQSGGIVPLLKGVLDALFENNPEHVFFIFCTIYNRGLLKETPKHTQFFSLVASTYWAEVDQLCQDNGIDVLFRSYPDEDPLLFPKSRQIFMIPDIQHEFFPEFFPPETIRIRRKTFNKALIGAGAICTLSDYARKTLSEHKWTRCKDIFLVSPALQVGYEQKITDRLTETEQKLLPTKDYFLFPANLWPHKNHRRVLKAFASFLDKSGRDMEFVFTGHPDDWPAMSAEFSDLPVKHLGFVSPQLLSALFKKATALVFFSLYEGFGIPLLEAFHHGTPVICSNTTSLPEVGGDAVLLCDPTDIEAMSSLMEKIVSCDSLLRKKLINNGKKRLDCYTWDKSALSLLDGIKRVADDINLDKPANQMRLTIQEPPLVTIVTPSYNQGRFLKRTIDSVVTQSYPYIEYMVIDGGSTDDSVDILKSYDDQFFWISKPDEGQAAAINKGFNRSNGQIQAYLNSDDILLPGTVSKVVEYFSKNPLTDMVYGLADYIDENDTTTGPYNTEDYSFANLMNDCCICQPAAFWRQRIAEKIGIFNEDLDLTMDYEYWLRIDRAGGEIFHLHDKLACSRLYAETKTMSKRSAIFQEIFKICGEHGGYVSDSYIHGYWHHRIYEATKGWPKYLKKIPRISSLISRWHSKKHQIQRFKNHQYLYQFLWAKWGVNIFKPLLCWQMPRKFLHRHAGSIGIQNAVLGVFSDNWMSPICTFTRQNISSGQDFYFTGVAIVDTTVTIKFNSGVIDNIPLEANKQKKVQFSLPSGGGGIIKLFFTNYHFDELSCRKFACRLIDTNLFYERDILL